MTTNNDNSSNSSKALSDEEKQRLISLAYGGELAYDKTLTVAHMVDIQARRTPEATAIVDCESSITYGELERRANAIASELIARSVERGAFVGIMLPRRKEFLISVLGVMKAGAAYVPLDSEYPAERLLYMLADSKAQMLITTRREYETKLREVGFAVENVLFIDEVSLNTPQSINLSTPDGLAYMLYTSGSTGQPKGVMTAHRSLRAMTAWMCVMLNVTSAKSYAAVPSFSFIAAWMDLTCPLTVGGCVHILSEELRTDLSGIREYFKAHGIAGFTTSTTFGMALLQQYDDLPTEFVMMGGEKMMPVRKSRTKVINGYGSTELTACAIYHIVDQSREGDIPIGRPAPNSYAYICDTEGQLVPQGEEGELCIESTQIALGYWGKEKLTAEKFVTSPRGGRMFRTGDLAKYNVQGEIEYIGRIDNLVKLRGFRIELGEIEHLMANYPDIKAQCVAVRELSGQPHLCAYYTSDHEIDSERLRTYLAERLADYMVPNIYVQLDQMPLTPNGKTDRRALPKPQIAESEIVAAETNTEERLCTIVGELLNYERFGVTTNLIGIGLTSLVAMKLSARIQTELQSKVAVKDILLHPTLRHIAQMIDADSTETRKARSYVRREYYPIAESQRGIYVEWEKNRRTTQYNLPYIKGFKGIDAETLAAAVKRVVEAHPSLNTRFAMKDSDVVQLRNDGQEPTVGIISLDHEPESGYFQRMVEPFDLLNDALCRFTVVQTPSTTYLFQDIHHIIFDGVSNLIFHDDLLRAINGETLQTEQYTLFDRAIDEQQWQQSEACAKADAYFDRLAADAHAARYPYSSTPDNGTSSADNDKTSADNDKAGVNTVVLQLERSDIERYCKANGFTANSFFMTMFAQTLHQLTREDKLWFASINNGRDNAEMQRLTGMFVKTLPVVSDLRASETLKDAIGSMQQAFMETVGHDMYPFSKAVGKLDGHPEIMFAYQGGVLDGDNGIMERDETLAGFTPDTAKFPIYVCIAPSNADEYYITLEYDTHLYSKADIVRLGETIKIVCRQTAAGRDAIGSIRLVDEKQTEALNALSLGGELAFDHTQTLVDIFCKQAQRTPNNVCLVFKNKRYTYEEMDKLTTRLAIVLQREYGVRQESIVGVMTDRSELMLVYPLAIMKAGGAYMPLDFTFPADRLQFMCEDADVQLILSEGNRVAEAMPQYKGMVVASDILPTLDSVQGELNHTFKAEADNMCVVLFTSGSTGEPKGVVLEHKGIVNFCHWYAKEFKLTASDRTVGYANFGFDAHIIDIYPVLSVGGSVYIISSEMRMDIMAMNEYMNDNSLTVAFLTTQVGCMFAGTLPNKSLRVLSTGGEKMPTMTKPAFDFYNVYGPTECSLFSTFYKIEGDFDAERSYIGRPLDNYRLYVVDRRMQLVPQGVPGELLVAGVGVGRGYLNRPELTAEKFIDYGGEKAYRTGDLVRWSEDGNIEFIGRIDNQVKLRGLRIELGEIEAKVAGFPSVKSCAVEVKEVYGMQHLCAYFTADRQVDTEELKTFLADKLTDYMLPTVYMQLDQMPLTPNGKTDRKALPDPQMAEEKIVEADTTTEKRLCTIVSGLLNHEKFGVTTNLIGVGLTSLTAMKLSARIQTELHSTASVKDILQHPTLRHIAQMIDADSGQIKKATPYERREYYPITESQRAIYVEWEMNRHTTQYNIPSVRRFDDAEASLLAAAVKRVVEAHPSLNTRFAMKDGDVVQLRNDGQEPTVGIISLDHEPENGYFQRMVEPFDLLADALYRFIVVQTPSTTYLFQDIHHIIFDGVSNLIFHYDLLRAINGEALQTEQYTLFDRAIDEQQWQQSEAYAKAEVYFDRLTADVQVARYPYSSTPDSDKASADNGKAGVNSVALKLERSDIARYCKTNGFTTNSFFMTIFAQTLHRLTREERLLFTSIYNGRDTAEMQRITGMFVKTLPVVSHLRASETLKNAIGRMQQAFTESIGHDLYPFSKAVGKADGHPEIMFIYQGGMADGGNTQAEKDVTLVDITLDKAKFPLAVLITPTEANAFELSVEYDTSLYGKADMLLLSKCFSEMCRRAMAVEDVDELKLISDDEEQWLITLSYGGELAYDKAETFVDMVERTAVEMPEATAIVDCESSITYAELGHKASALAEKLIASGVEKNSFVGVMLPRRKEFVVSVLGVMKAGAAYIPLDSEYPAARIRYMLADSGAKVLITSRTLYEQTLRPTDVEGRKVLFVDELVATVKDVNDKPVKSINLSTPSGLAYMIYTSGSTGQPKGVVVAHRSLRAFIAWQTHSHTYQPGGSYALYPSFSFDASIIDMVGALATGGCLHILSEDVRNSLAALREYCTEKLINGISLPTALGMMLLDDSPQMSLDFVRVGGEKLLPTAPTNIRIINEYGPTEFTITSSCHIVDQRVDADIPIGRPVPNTYAYICDTLGQILPQGTVGELCLEGEQAAVGYWQREELTAEKFVASPRGGRMYRTGDLARYNARGELEFIGRTDSQVKLRGFRIELGEIERQMASFPGVQTACAMVREMGGQQHLCAYYTAQHELNIAELRAYLAERLADHMLPSAIIKLDSMPLTPSGKIDRKALPEPHLERHTGREPSTEGENLFCRLFAEVLHLDKVYADDNFFLLGGTSLTAMRLLAAATGAGVEIAYADVFSKPSPAQLATMADIPDATTNKSAGEEQFSRLDDYDYTAINNLLAKNTLDNFLSGERTEMRGVLLTGTTGFLGMHVLHHLLTSYPDTHVYCLTRPTSELSSEQRLTSLFFYYFSTTPDEEGYANRMTIVNGDITSDEWWAALEGCAIDTLINCAANVKHFSQGTDIEDVNYRGVLRLIDFCEQNNVRMVHVSTYSVAGARYTDEPLPSGELREDTLYIGQMQLSKYTQAKYLAERTILQSVADGRLTAKIMRVGNLSPRASDGEFQANMHTNASMSRLRAIHLMGCHPRELEQETMELSPIDIVARAILLLAQTPRANVVFHPYDINPVTYADICTAMNELGLTTHAVEREVWEQALAAALRDEDSQEKLTGLLAYRLPGQRRAVPLGVCASLTTDILRRLGLSWPAISSDYIANFIDKLCGLGYFE